MTSDSVDRRPLLKAMAGGAVTLAAVGAGARVFLHDDDSDDGPALTLSAESGSDVASLYVALGDDLLPQTRRRQWDSSQLPTSTHSMVAFTWTEPATAPHLTIRSRRGGRWGEWQRVPVLHDLPDADSGEGTDLTGTDLVWIGRSDGIQVRLTGARPADLRLLLLHPAAHSRDLTVGRSSRAVAGAVVVRPDILDRVAWGADESWRSGTPRVNATIEQAHVHHTVSRNDYAPEDVPALIRGMYRYHTKTLGWSDIAYNFLVDRFGRIWTGRAGGASKPIRGAHTLGFNATSVGISVIGNYELVVPSTETLDAIAAVAAWKLNLYARDPLGSTAVTSEGSDKFRSGAVVTLPVIDGHRDTNDTSCPGSNVYVALPDIRARARARIDSATAAALAPVAVVTPTTITGAAVLGQSLTAVAGTYDPPEAAASYAWLRDGVAIAGATAASYAVSADDVGHQLSVQVAAAVTGRQPAAEQVAAGAVVGALAIVTIQTEPKAKRAIVRVKVAAPPGVAAPPTGQVVVHLGKRKRTITLAKGRGSTRFVHVKAGDHRVRAVYSGAGLLLPTTARAGVTVS